MAEKNTMDIAIYAEEQKVTDVMVAIPVPFVVEPFPFEDSPKGPKTNVLRYSGEWSDEYDAILRRMKARGVIRRFSRRKKLDIG